MGRIHSPVQQMQDELERKSIRDEQTPEQIFELRKMSSEQSAYYNVNKEEGLTLQKGKRV